jgi:hypothetical protein
VTGICIEAVAAKEPYVASDYKKGLVIIPALFILAFLLSFIMKDKEPTACRQIAQEDTIESPCCFRTASPSLR